MSIWMLLLFTVSMCAAVLGFGSDAAWSPTAIGVFALTLAIFVGTALFGGVRRPVI